MDINIQNAATLFFPNPSLELVFFESLANSIDSGSTKISIEISIESFPKPETLTIEIKDNGTGFLDENFEKFSKLLEVKEKDHKGIGRLVFLKYFNEVEIKSSYNKNLRTFKFHNEFNGENIITPLQIDINETILKFSGFKGEKIKSYDYLKPSSLKKSILLHFFPLLYTKKLQSHDFEIELHLTTKEPNLEQGFINETAVINSNKIPDLTELIFQEPLLAMFDDLHLYYSIKESEEDSVITAICVDGRTVPVNILSKENIPSGYEIVFLLFSDFFTGKVNNSRQELNLSNSEMRVVTNIFTQKIAEILMENVPKIKERNTQVFSDLNNRYPHLIGYFDEHSVGIIDRNNTLQIAQNRFFIDQKKILEAVTLTEEEYSKSIEISSRILMEYILYRSLIIDKLKTIDKTHSEKEIHDIILPTRRAFKKSDFIHDLYANNAWLLDDKYMSYNTILSDLEMEKLIAELEIEADATIISDVKRPDIAIVFSKDPEKSDKVDVVIVELKKLGVDLAKQENVVSQLKQRARKLLEHYQGKIQRIWFYGIAEIDEEFERSLYEEKFTPLYSNDKVYYKEHPIIVDMKTKAEVPVGLFILSFDAFLKDAEDRNSTFLNLLKDGFKQPQ